MISFNGLRILSNDLCVLKMKISIHPSIHPLIYQYISTFFQLFLGIPRHFCPHIHINYVVCLVSSGSNQGIL